MPIKWLTQIILVTSASLFSFMTPFIHFLSKSTKVLPFSWQVCLSRGNNPSGNMIQVTGHVYMQRKAPRTSTGTHKDDFQPWACPSNLYQINPYQESNIHIRNCTKPTFTGRLHQQFMQLKTQKVSIRELQVSIITLSTERKKEGKSVIAPDECCL